MAGDRHHILPRFLLKGFASRISGKEVFTWAYRKDGTIFEPNTTKISVEKHFYGKEGEVSVDAEITDLEDEFANLLDELRAREEGIEITGLKIPEFIAHLCIRTKHLRDSFLESSEFLMDRISEFLSDYNNIKKLLANNFNLEGFEKILEDQQIPQPYRPLVRWFLQNMDSDFGQESILRIFFQTVTVELKKVTPKATKEGHIKAMAKNIIPEVRTEDYRLLHWFICKSKTPLILGDSGCLFELVGPQRFKSINDKNDKIANIFLPISSDRMLIGRAISSAPQVDSKAINEVIAKSSREYFVCSERSEEIASLLALIATDSELISKEDIEQIVKGLLIKSN